MVEVMKIMVTSFKRSHACTAALSAPTLCRPLPTYASSRDSWTLTGKSGLVCFGVAGSWCAQGFVCAFQESVSAVLCKFWFLYGKVNGKLLQEGLCHTQAYCTQSPCPCSGPLLTHTSSGDTQTQVCLSLCGVSGSWCAQGMFESSEHLWAGMGFDSKCDFAPPIVLLGLLLCP